MLLKPHLFGAMPVEVSILDTSRFQDSFLDAPMIQILTLLHKVPILPGENVPLWTVCHIHCMMVRCWQEVSW